MLFRSEDYENEIYYEEQEDIHTIDKQIMEAKIESNKLINELKINKNNIISVQTTKTFQNILEPKVNIITEDLSMNNTIDITSELLLIEQKRDKILLQVREWKINNELPNTKLIHIHPVLKHFVKIIKGIEIHEETELLCYLVPENEPIDNIIGKLKIIIPLNLIIPIFNLAHNGPLQGHHGRTKTLHAIQTTYYFPGLYKWIATLTKDCFLCQTNKPIQKNRNTAQIQSPVRKITETFHTIHIDFKGPLSPTSNGNSYILVIIDSFSRFIQATPTKDATSHSALKALQAFIYRFGIPNVIVCDRGTHFMSKDFINFTTNLDIQIKPLSGYNPWSNGLVETMNTHVARYIRQLAEAYPKNWSNIILQWQFAQNTSQVLAIGMTPYEAVFNKKPTIPIQLKLGIIRDKEKNCIYGSNPCIKLPKHSHFNATIFSSTIQKFILPELTSEMIKRENNLTKVYDMVFTHSKMDHEDVHANRNIHNLAQKLTVGQLVLIENKDIIQGISHKLLPLRKGIYKVIKEITEVTYQIEHLETKKILLRHRNLLLPYYPKILTIPHIDRKSVV